MRYLVAVALLIFAPLIGVAAEPAGVDLPSKDQFHLFLLIGQSNMAGRGKVAAEDRVPHPRVWMLNQQRQWVPAVDPLHFDKPKVVGVGLGRAFGIAVAEANPEITVGLVPCAVGGSPISSWEPGGYHASTKTYPYDEAILRVKAALESGTIKGILWHQGESDAKPGLAEQHEEKLQALINRFRTSIDSPELPFIAGQMGQFEEMPWTDAKKQVDSAQQNLMKHVPHCAFVRSDGLSHKGDEVHFDAASYRELGKRYAEAYLKLRKTD